jgi:hypothetical protein
MYVLRNTEARSHNHWCRQRAITIIYSEFDVRESVHRYIIMKATNKMQLYKLIYYSYSALHVSGDVFVHHQEHLTGSIHPSRCWLVSWMS